MMAKPWDKHRETTTKLYITEGRTLEDVRGIMKTYHNFEASIRSYRQHFDIWDIGKYNCKKRQQRRRQFHKRTILPGPLRSPPALSSASETSDPGSSPASSCGSQHSPEQQLSLPAIQQPPRYAQSPYFDAHKFLGLQSSSSPEPCIKIENGGGKTGWRDVPMYPSAALHPSQSMLQSCVPSSSSPNPKKSPICQGKTYPFQRNVHFAYADSAHGPVHQAPPPSSAATPRTTTAGHRYGAYRIPPDMARWHQVRMPPNMSRGDGAWRPWCLASPSVSLPISFRQEDASG
ncbi:hypothetical protein FALCPG4_015489 [Fusarium falciforme]